MLRKAYGMLYLILIVKESNLNESLFARNHYGLMHWIQYERRLKVLICSLRILTGAFVYERKCKRKQSRSPKDITTEINSSISFADDINRDTSEDMHLHSKETVAEALDVLNEFLQRGEEIAFRDLIEVFDVLRLNKN